MPFITHHGYWGATSAHDEQGKLMVLAVQFEFRLFEL